MRRFGLQMLVAAVAAATVPLASAAPAHAAPVPVYPGMEIRQDTNLCTLGYVDPVRRIAFTAGHCRGSGPVTDRMNNFIGGMALFRNNTPDGKTVATDELIADYEAIGLADDALPSNALPGGRRLEADPGLAVHAGQPVCHFGVTTGESCGTIEAVNNGWFTMTNGVVSQKGDSGGPVYVIDGGRAVLVGLFISTWGDFPTAVSWQAISAQVAEDIRTAGVPVGSQPRPA